MKAIISSLLALIFFHVALGNAAENLVIASTQESLTTVIPVCLTAYSADSLNSPDMMLLNKGDSIFIFEGELFYHARANGQEFFIAASELLPRTDSLVIYQNLRIVNKATTGALVDTVNQKIIRQRCTAITKDGSRCSRLALPGQTKCWQHKSQ